MGVLINSKLLIAIVASNVVFSLFTGYTVYRDTRELRDELTKYENLPIGVSPESVKQAILSNPMMLVEAGKELQNIKMHEQEQTSISLTSAASDELLKAMPGILGNKNGKHVIVEFFDYQCPHCRAIEDFLKQQVAKDPELKIIRREISALGEGSAIAARVALASAKQGLYDKVSIALMHTQVPITLDSAIKTATEAGADANKLKEDYASTAVIDQLQSSNNLSIKVGVIGTPAFAAPSAGVMNGVESKDEFEKFIRKASNQ